MRITYIHGPGDAYGTFKQWLNRADDTRIIKKTYSGQFYDLVSTLGAKAQLICVTPCGDGDGRSFEFTQIPRKSGSGWRHYTAELAYARAVGRAVRRFAPDYIIYSGDFPTMFCDMLPRGPVKIISMHNTFWPPFSKPEGLKARVMAAATAWGLRHTNRAVCVSPECARQFMSARNAANAYATIQIPRLTTSPDLPPRMISGPPKAVSFVGRLEENKGITDLIEAFARVRVANPDLTLRVVGDGAALEACQKRAQTLSLDASITFTGALDAAGVQAIYEGTDICVCPTRGAFCEGLATIPLEAAAFGVPTLMSSAVPAKQLFGAALTFQESNVDDLTAKLAHILGSPSDYQAACDDATASFASAMTDYVDWHDAMRSCILRAP